MEPSDQELIRRALMKIVERIDAGDSKGEPPVVLVVLGEGRRSNEKPELGNQISHPSVERHPGLERFHIAEPQAAGVPKYCFMEPDRVCVNSGACEMLGN
ncbi:MAG TPA: hypothetical protein VKA70_02880 [Blastocatellia bacterium]|nr:hypothetical protein [Blastocatellia bacterium]